MSFWLTIARTFGDVIVSLKLCLYFGCYLSNYNQNITSSETVILDVPKKGAICAAA